MTALTAQHHHQGAYPPQQRRHQHQHQHQQTALAASSPSRAPAGPSTHSTPKNTDHTPRPQSSGHSVSRPTRNDPDLATMPSRPGTNGTSTADSNGPRPIRRVTMEGTGPTNGQSESPTDSSDSDRKIIERPSNQKKLTIITSQDDGTHSRSQRPKPPLQRSKSDYAVRRDEPEAAEDEAHEWGARHGFEDHYQSEDIISQLASVSELDFLS